MSQHSDFAEEIRIHHDTVLDRWVEYTLTTYQSSDFFKKETDQFLNPVGGTIRRALAELLPLLVEGAGRRACEPAIERIIAIRAVQQFTPSQAVAPLNAVKHICRDVCAVDKKGGFSDSALYDFDFAVDLALLAAFDIYMKYRERLYSVRVKEIKSGNIVLTDSKCPSKLLQEGIPPVQVGS